MPGQISSMLALLGLQPLLSNQPTSVCIHKTHALHFQDHATSSSWAAAVSYATTGSVAPSSRVSCCYEVGGTGAAKLFPAFLTLCTWRPCHRQTAGDTLHADYRLAARHHAQRFRCRVCIRCSHGMAISCRHKHQHKQEQVLHKLFNKCSRSAAVITLERSAKQPLVHSICCCVCQDSTNDGV